MYVGIIYAFKYDERNTKQHLTCVWIYIYRLIS